jgi:hypothetical protein
MFWQRRMSQFNWYENVALIRGLRDALSICASPTAFATDRSRLEYFASKIRKPSADAGLARLARRHFRVVGLQLPHPHLRAQPDRRARDRVVEAILIVRCVGRDRSRQTARIAQNERIRQRAADPVIDHRPFHR